MRAGTLMLAATAMAFTGVAVSAKDAKPNPDAAGIVAGRQAAYLMSGATFGAMKGAIDKGVDVKTQAFAARGLARWAKAIPGMFPAGTNIAPTNALPNVWSDRAGFETKAADYAAAADKLAGFAKAGDAVGFATQWAETGKTCKACHDTYRKPDEPKKPS